MRVDLHTLKPNPMRDFTVDPIDQEAVDKLRQPIKNHGFWGGVICRRTPDGTIQIGAGHHRVEAALAEGITEADVAVYDDRDDTWMAHQVYARENATQRGNNAVAEAGSVAAAIRWLAKAIVTGVCEEFFTNHDLPKLRGNLTGPRGLGLRAIEAFLGDAFSGETWTLREHLANLKASGDYARIIGEVADVVRRESDDAAVLMLASQAAAQAHEHHGTRTFDFPGVAQHLRNTWQIQEFRSVATGKGMKDALPVEKQAELAQRIVEVSGKYKKGPVSGAFIREHIMSLFLGARTEAHRLDRRTQVELEEADARLKIHKYGRDISRSLRLIAATGSKMEELTREHPEAFVTLIELGELQKALKAAKQFIDLLHERLCP
jgi:hypothetical protein